MKDNEMFDINLGRALRAEREKKGMTQPEVAEKLGVTKVAVHQWEAGKRSMYAQTLSEYCRVLGVSIEYIFSRM